MVAPTFEISKSSAAKATGANGEGLRYRLDVVAASAADVVQSAGGWLYDRAMAGWEVTVLLPRGCDTRSLRILGVGVADLEPELAGLGAGTASLAVSAEAFTADARVRDAVLEALDNRLTEVALWGEGWPLGVNRATARAQHLLSGAARMFKGYALAAAGIPGATVDATEALLCDVGSGTDSELIRLD
ncbi:hypothetical protein [Mycobacterium mantenii]|uniref:Uncharacterized protein n=1 Tax=Mycobacterium mantenii TaxID=560555 RepID=A0A1A2TD72_MYCNT|nr:hypothetical protein [Mycobacterium mantenii]OBH40073.1 hypothetical protein A5688_20035 [Mycobacterium mantenii]OBH65385.1 hypothetical protein A5683_12660 [Mycobacterium mantenii]OBH74358.1 hypothetical protein A5682_03810 [Mycobacterium mantenii]